MSSKDGFHDSGGDDVLFDQGAGHTHTFSNFPDSAIDIEDDDETEDKSKLLNEDGSKKSPSFWTFEYYQQFFDVETSQVFNRVAGSMIPLPKRNYLQLHIRPNPDLYGPFWICTTLVFTTAIAGNLANYLSSAGKDYHWRYDFHKVTFAATAIFSYWWLIPAIMYGFLWWRKSQAGFSFLEILCVYGYSLAIYIPISVSMVILWVINVTWFKWVLVVVGAVMSGGVLLLTFWPAVKEETKNIAAVFLGLIFLFHLGLAAGFVLYFFHVPPPMTPPQTTTTVAPTRAPLKLEQKIPAGVPAGKPVTSQQEKPKSVVPGSIQQNMGDQNANPNVVKQAPAGMGGVGDAGVNAGGNNLNKNVNQADGAGAQQPGNAVGGVAGVANAGNAGDGGVQAENNKIQTLQKAAGGLETSKTRTKLDTAHATATNTETKNENIDTRVRKIRSRHLNTNEKLLKNRNVV